MFSQNIFFWLKRNLVVLVVIILVVVFIWLFPALQDTIERGVVLVGETASSVPLLAMLVFVALSAASAILTFFSSVIFVPSAVVAWGGVTTSILVLIGWILGGIFSYTLAYYLGPPIVKKIIGPKKFDHYVGYFIGKITFWMILVFRIAVPSEIGGFLLGLLRYPFFKYLLATAISELPFAIVLVYAGDAFLKQNFGLVIGITTAITLSIIFFGYLLHNHLGFRRVIKYE